ncbi:hypothetical protein AAFC00_002299 [Neodothiora populina]|uniref:BTB domain-containing protein n=1 Tax=Neodothiora populina TaxID=2781224 RepID=A0ABR3PGZ3_9PEZI
MASAENSAVITVKHDAHSYFNNPVLSDVIVKFGDPAKKVHVLHLHRVVLAQHLEWFHLAFSGPFKESKEPTIDLGNEDNPEAMMAMLRYCYGLALIINQMPKDEGSNEERLHDSATSIEASRKARASLGIQFAFDVFVVAHKYNGSCVREKILEGLNTPNVENEELISLLQLTASHEFADKRLLKRALSWTAAEIDD